MIVTVFFAIVVIGSLYAIERELREIKHILREAIDKNNEQH